MKKIILITNQFPYEGGEQFLETEVQYYHDTELILMPKIKNGHSRKVPSGIAVDDFLSKNSFLKSKIVYLLKSFGSTIFYKELFSENFLNIKKLKIFLSSIYLYQMYYEIFDSYFSKTKNTQDIIVYTYWNDEATYALQSLKDKYQYKLISRIHGGDLYKERKLFDYMPLKKQFTKNIDTLYTITQSANSYLENTYGFNKDVLKLSRLGVEDRAIITRSSENRSLNIVSCSFLTEVKQVDKIIKSLKILASQMKNIMFSWIHIGDGILTNDLQALAKEELGMLDNVKYSFVGNYTNEQVYEFYAENEIDIFVNVSLSEGVPVSIMEAMSCCIPIVAPDVGGVSDMVINEYNGKLLSSTLTIDKIVTALSDIDFVKNREIKDNSYKIYREKYNADKNYNEFIQNIKG